MTDELETLAARENELVKRVALAIHRVKHGEWPNSFFHERTDKCKLSPIYARAAIAAMKEPDYDR